MMAALELMRSKYLEADDPELEISDAGEDFVSELEDLVSHAEALDGWLRKGGFMPGAWVKQMQMELSPEKSPE